MHPKLKENKLKLDELCRRFRVERLYVFGSAATDQFKPESSDYDFLVSLKDRTPTPEYADRFLNFADELEQIVGRRIDLVSEASIRNPYFRAEVEKSREIIYESKV